MKKMQEESQENLWISNGDDDENGSSQKKMRTENRKHEASRDESKQLLINE